MLFWLILIIFIISIIIDYKVEKPLAKMLTCTSIFGSGLAIIISIIIIAVNYFTIDAFVSQNQELYKSLRYKAESEACKDELGLLSKEVLDEIEEWNVDVEYYQTAQDNFWIGIYYPNIYDQFEKIPYSYCE